MDEDYKKTKRKATVTAIFGILFVIALYAVPMLMLFPPRVPPDIAAAERFLKRNQADIQLLVDYFIAEGYGNVIIWDADGTMKADFREMEIPDADVVKAVDRLFSARSDMRIYKAGNTIEFTFWSHPQEIGSCIAYSIDHISLPDVQFATETTAMSVEGWYYVIEDYNLWRVNHHRASCAVGDHRNSTILDTGLLYNLVDINRDVMECGDPAPGLQLDFVLT